MKELIAHKLVFHLQEHPSCLFQRLELAVLMHATAHAFRMRGRHVLWAKDPLAVYAAYTAEAAKRPGTDRQRLYETMRYLGRRIRVLSGFKEPRDLYDLLFLLYRHLGISLCGNTEEGFHFTACYFSRVYTPQACALISAMDSGIVAGLFGEGTLVFTKRITEGCTSCEACFQRRES